MHLPEVSVRFGLMLEAYCRGCGSYMQDLTKQYHALDGMRQISQTLQKSSVSSLLALDALHYSFIMSYISINILCIALKQNRP